MTFSFPGEFRNRMRALYGAEGDVWLAQLPALVRRYGERWSLTLDGPVPSPSYNYVIKGRQRDGQPVALKLGVPNKELLTEIEALRLYDGCGCARLLAAEPDEGALLLEWLEPGEMLVTLEDDEEATRIVTQVMQALWRPLPEQHPFPTTAKWARGLERLRATFHGGVGPFPKRLVEAAERFFADLLASQAPPVLLHGDLHHYNILSAQRAPWLAIDPKGLSGEPLYETGALLRNPTPQVAAWSDLQRISARRVDILAEMLEADRDRPALEQMPHAPGRRLVRERLALEQHHLGRADVARVARGLEGNGAIAAVADDAKAPLPDRLDVLAPGVEQNHLQAAFGQQSAEQAAHGAGTDDQDLRMRQRHRRHEASRNARTSASSISLPR